MTTRLLLLASLAIVSPLLSADHPALLRSGFIYEKAPYPACHASTIVEPTPGHLVAAWFGGTAEKNPDVGIWVARHDGAGWSTPVEVANGVRPDAPRVPTWNPVLFQPKSGPLLLFYKVGPSPQTWWGELRTSTDGGRSWSAARRLPAGIYGPIKNKPVQLADGTLLCPTSDETDEKPSKWRVYFERTRDLGATWTKTEFFNDGLEIGAIQPSVLFLGGEKLQAVGRTRQGKVFTIASPDLGRTWGKMALTSLPNPDSGTDAVTLADGRHLLVYNHNIKRTATAASSVAGTPKEMSDAKSDKGRNPLNVAISTDGIEWRSVFALENEPGAKDGFSYPAVIQTADGLVHITYTWKRVKIRHVVLDPKKL
jgi:predicted neuraminidase